MFNTVTPMPIPDLTWRDWGIIYVGLSIGVGLGFEILHFLAKLTNHQSILINNNPNDVKIIKRNESKILSNKVYTLKHFWLLLSGVIHCWIEFHFVFYRSTSIIKPTIDMYAAADYRYGDYGGSMESGTAAMEAITALAVGPLCLLVAIASVTNNPSLHALQIITCTMQLYGLTWFTLQPLFTSDGLAGTFSQDPILFWVIAVGCNAPWGIFPFILLIESFISIYNNAKQNSLNLLKKDI